MVLHSLPQGLCLGHGQAQPWVTGQEAWQTGSMERIEALSSVCSSVSSAVVSKPLFSVVSVILYHSIFR